MAPRKNYTPLQMTQAIDAVKRGEKISTAAKKYGVPRVTLHDKISGRTPEECSMGPKTYLSTMEEAILEKWVLEMAEKHIPVTRDELLDSVQRIIIDQKKITPFTDNRPGRKWYNLFLNRHPTLSERTAQNLTTARDAVTEEDIRCWFIEVKSYLHEKNLQDVIEDPARIFNTDESAFFLSPKVGKVLAKKGDKHIYQSSGDEKDNLTVLITGNAAGQLAPPMVVFAYERIPSTISSHFPEDWAIGRSQSGWMCGSTFYEYIVNIFNPWLLQQNIQKPVVFYLDGHRSHLTLHLSNFCADNGIEIIALHPNSTHILQPMDLAIFRPLKTYWRKAVKDWKLQHLGQLLKKENFAPVLKTALQSITEDSIKNGFRAGGLYPFGPDYVDLTKIKSRQKPQVSTDQTIFFNYLEKEIVAKLGTEKLQFFNELFYKGRDTLNSRLNEEDTSLYIIWASNKQTVESSDHVNERSSIQTEVDLIEADIPNQPDNSVPLNDITAFNNSTSDILINLTARQESEETINNTSIIDKPSCFNITDSVSIASTSCSLTSAAAESTTLKETTRPEQPSPTNLTARHESAETTNTTSIIDKPSCFNITDSVLIASTSCSITSADAESTTSKKTTRPEPKEMSNDELIVNKPSSSNQYSLQTASNSYTSTDTTSSKETITSESKEKSNEDRPSLSIQTNSSLQLASTSAICIQSAAEKTPLKDMTVPNCTSRFVPNKVGNTYIPSPFKRNLFWPGEDDDKKGKKRRLKEKIPCAITSKPWRDYHERKEEQKREIQKQKEIKAQEREKKRQLKQREIENRKQKRLTVKENKKKIRNRIPNSKPNNTSSDNTDTEVNYAESEDSYNMEMEEEITDSEQATENNEKSDNSESEDVPLSKFFKPAKTYSSGDYVIIKYEGEFFPGVIKNVDRNKFEISTMTFSVGNTFKWPEKEDKIWYHKSDIVKAISKPVLCNKRGFYTIPEMKEYQPFAM